MQQVTYIPTMKNIFIREKYNVSEMRFQTSIFLGSCCGRFLIPELAEAHNSRKTSRENVPNYPSKLVVYIRSHRRRAER